MSMSYTNLNENMFKLNIDDVFNEPVNLDRAKVLLKLDFSKFKSLIWIDDNNNENGEFWKPETYIHCAKKFLLNVINNDGINNSSYKYSTKMRDCGRMYTKSFGVQSLQKQLRGYLTGDTLIDFDMINCHPTILLYICKRFYPNYTWVELTKYVNCRKWYLNKYNLEKTDILKMMNSNYSSTKLNLEKEFKLIQSLLYDKTPECLKFMDKYKTEKQNPKGKFLNKILCIFENMILHTALSTMPTDTVKVKMYDGFMTSNNIDTTETINKLNKSTSEYGIKWSVKEPDLSIVDELKDVEVDDQEILNYENVKTKFEQNHFMVEHPLLFGKEYELDGVKKYSLVGYSDFNILTKPYIYEDLEGGKLVKKSILNRWVADKTKRSYKTLDFIPSTTTYKPDVYNTFTGFDYDTKNKQYTPNKTVVKDFINHIGLLCDYEQKSIDYIIKWIAHTIQKTTELPKVCLLFKSHQGFGKDLLINFIEKMLGDHYVYRTAETDDIFGNFNSVIRDKIVLQLNELEGKDGFSNKEKLKNLITQEKVKINEKNVKAYSQTNYLRIVICSNNLTPIEIPCDNRRYCVFQSTQCKPSISYFEKLANYLSSKDAIYTLYDYFNNVNIEDIILDDPKVRPITSAYKEMKQVVPLYKYINEMFKDEEYKNEFVDNFKIHKKTGDVIIQPNKIMSCHKDWASCNNINNYKIDFKLMKGLLDKIGINSKEMKIGGTKTMYYVFKLEPLRAKLIDLNIDDGDVEVYEEDDFE
jgi:hypothetical protein